MSRNQTLVLVAALLLAAFAPTPVAAADPTGATPIIVVDWPSDGAMVPARLLVTGWAVVEPSERGTGVDGVRAYLDGPAGTGTPLARAAYGLTRPDVAVARGEGRYAPSGWRLEADVPPGSRALYLYAHLADQPDEEGWLGPVQIAVHVAGGAPAVTTAPREPTAPSAAGGVACSERDQAAGRCASAGAPGTPDCTMPDRETGRCLVRPPAANRATAPGVGAVPGSWIAGPAAGTPGAVGSAAAPAGPAAASAPASQDATMAGARGLGAAMSLTAAPTVGRQVQLYWNQLADRQVTYEVRRCPAVGSAILTCEVVATAQAGGYRLLHGDGIYVVRAVGPQGQLHGESNRLHVSYGAVPTVWQ
jgi:hypothetical protein